MTGRNWWWVMARIVPVLVTVLALAVAGCGSDDDEAADEGGTTTEATSTGEGEECETMDKVTLQLKWVTQAQFAGYYAADEEGYYEDNCLDVTIKPGGPDIV